MDRQLIAYLLILLTALAVAIVVSFKLYHSRDRSYRRRLKRERVEYDRMIDDRADK